MKRTNYILSLLIAILAFSQSIFYRGLAQEPAKTHLLEDALEGTQTYDYVARESIKLSTGFSYKAETYSPQKITGTWIYSGSPVTPSITLNGTTYDSPFVIDQYTNTPANFVQSGQVLSYELQSILGPGWQFNYTGGSNSFTIEVVGGESSFTYGGNYSYMSLDQDYQQTNNSFTASIDEAMVLDVEYLEEEEIPDASNRPLNTTEMTVGSTPGSFNVSPSGAATYTIPIAVPPGTAGMQPSVSVAYNNQAGNGLMGLGWNLTGISAITRVPSTIYHDGNDKVDGVDFDDMDRFALNGNRLIKTDGTYGVAGSKYKTEITDFSVITAYGNAGNGPSYFILETKDGKTLEFGNTPNSKIEAQNKSDVLVWYLNKVKDTKGNYIKYEYYEDNATGEFYPKKISYTGTSSYEPYNAIEFFYEERTDKSTAYVGGAKVSQNVLLYRIKVSADEALVKNYFFEYKNDGYSKLVRVTEGDKEDNQFNATIFEWGTKNTAQFDYQNLGGENYFFYTGDFNGDGRQDLLKFPKKDDFVLDDKWEVYLSDYTGTSFTKPANGEGLLVDPMYYDTGGVLIPDNNSFASFTQMMQAVGLASSDLNGDGLDDFVITGFLPKNSSDILEDTYYVLPMYSTASSAGECYFIKGAPLIFHDYQPQLFLGDFDGDNVAEIISYQDKDGVNEWNMCDFTKNPNKQSLNYNYGITSSDKVMAGDLDGDGRSELINFHTTLVNYYNYDGTTLVVNSCPGGPSSLNSLYLGDYNGDGKSDVLAYNGSNWKLYFFNGTYFITYPSYPQLALFDPDDSDDNHNIYLGDFNRDGKTDIVQTNKSGSDVVLNYCFFNGTEFEYPTKTLSGNNAHKHYFTFADFNGDGQSDLMYYSNPFNLHKTIVDDPNGTARLIKKFTNGLNFTNDISYGVLPNSTHYIRGTFPNNPSTTHVMDFKGPIYFVTWITARDEIRSQIHFANSWTYYAAKIHRRGKGFLGFMGTDENNETSPGKVHKEYNYDVDYFNVYPEKVTTYYQTQKLTETTNSYDKIIPHEGKKIICPFADMVESLDVLKNVTITTNSSYYPDGNLNTVSADYNGEGNTTTVYEDYTQLGKPQTITITKERGSESYSRSKNLTYDDDGLLHTKITDPLKTNWVKNTYTYDGFGNIIEFKTESPDLDARTSSKTYDDAKHRFVKTVTNAESHTESFTYDPAYGNLLTQTDANGLVTAYEYDGFGRLKRTILPSGKTINTTAYWDINNADFPKVVYYTKTSSTGSPESRTYTDQLGRKWLNETQGHDGAFVRVENNYNADGRISGKTLPYYQGDSKIWENYTYKPNDGRLEKTTLGSNEKTYSYTGNKIIFTDAGGNTIEKNFNAFGELNSVTDEGGTVNYTYYGHGGIKSIVSNGATYTIEYDDYERQKKLIDPDAGPTNYVYNAYGELKEQTDAMGNKYTFEYDNLGRIITKNHVGGNSVTYAYDTETNGIGQIASVSSTDGATTSYKYDELSWVKEISRDLSADANYDDLTFKYEYNASGDVTRITYPSDFSVTNHYNTYGYLTNVKRADNSTNIWHSPEYNSMGQPTNYTYGNNIENTRTYTAYGLPTRIQAGTIQDSEYSFNQANGTLNWRKNNKHKNGSNESFMETFGYDDLYRLTSITPNNGATTVNMGYNGSMGSTNGTIASKTDVGDYQYQGTHSHAVTMVSNPGVDISNEVQDIHYTPFNKIETITQGGFELNVLYNEFEERLKTELKENSTVKATKYFAGDYEIVIDSLGNAKHLHYIYADPGLACIMEKAGGNINMHYVHSDYLGSVEYITNASGTLEQELSYDAWGRLRNPSNWGYSGVTTPMFGRGFTLHEHLPEFNLINMGGRVYDPVLGMFLSPDNYVQAPDFTQNFNRYGYAFNNPLMYSDPSGDWIIPLITTLAGSYLGGVQANNYELNPGKWDWGSFSTYYSIATGGFSGYKLGSSLEERYNDNVEYRKLIEYQKKFSSDEQVLLASNNGVGKPTDLQKLNNGLRQSMYTKAKYDAEYEFANDAYKHKWSGVPYKYERIGDEIVVDENSLYSKPGYNLAQDIDISKEILGYVEGGYHVFTPKNFEPTIHHFTSSLVLNTSGSGLPSGPAIRFYDITEKKEIALILFKTWNALELFNKENYTNFNIKIYNQLIKGYGISPTFYRGN